MKKLFLITFILFISIVASATSKTKPSFEKIVENSEDLMYSRPDSVIVILEDVIHILEKNKDTLLLIRARNCYGICFAMLGDNKKALRFFRQNESMLKNSKHLQSLSTVYGNIANVYAIQSDFPKSLEYNFKGLKIQEKLSDTSSMAVTYNNIGNIYSMMGDHSNSLLNYNKSIELIDSVSDPGFLGRSLANIGGVYADMNLTDSAMKYMNRALPLFQMTGDTQSVAMLYNNLAAELRDAGKLNDAIIKQKESIRLKKILGDKGSLSNSYSMLGDLFLRKNNYFLAIENCMIAEKMAIESHTLSYERDACSCLYIAYQKSENYKNAFSYFTKFISLRDSIINQDKIQEITERRMNFEFERERLNDSLSQVEIKLEEDFLQRQKDAENETRINNQFIYTITGAAAFGLMLVIAFILFRSNKRKKQDNEIITQQKIAVELQRNLVEEKNKEIVDSIKLC